MRIFDAENISSVFLNSDEVYEIKVSAIPGNEIKVKTHSGGEYFNDIGLDAEIKENKLILTSKFRDKLQGGFDKLSAHKVFAIKVFLEVPFHLYIDIVSNLATVYATGNYEKIVVQLKSGSCFLQDFSGNALINTFDGNIEVETKNAIVEAYSRNGKVKIRQKFYGKNKLKLSSIDGDIIVKKND